MIPYVKILLFLPFYPIVFDMRAEILNLNWNIYDKFSINWLYLKCLYAHINIPNGMLKYPMYAFHEYIFYLRKSSCNYVSALTGQMTRYGFT